MVANLRRPPDEVGLRSAVPPWSPTDRHRQLAACLHQHKPLILLVEIGAGEGIRTLDPDLGKMRRPAQIAQRLHGDLVASEFDLCAEMLSERRARDPELARNAILGPVVCRPEFDVVAIGLAGLLGWPALPRGLDRLDRRR